MEATSGGGGKIFVSMLSLEGGSPSYLLLRTKTRGHVCPKDPACAQKFKQMSLLITIQVPSFTLHPAPSHVLSFYSLLDLCYITASGNFFPSSHHDVSSKSEKDTFNNQIAAFVRAKSYVPPDRMLNAWIGCCHLPQGNAYIQFHNSKEPPNVFLP